LAVPAGANPDSSHLDATPKSTGGFEPAPTRSAAPANLQESSFSDTLFIESPGRPAPASPARRHDLSPWTVQDLKGGPCSAAAKKASNGSGTCVFGTGLAWNLAGPPGTTGASGTRRWRSRVDLRHNASEEWVTRGRPPRPRRGRDAERRSGTPHPATAAAGSQNHPRAGRPRRRARPCGMARWPLSSSSF
jgi:hypothetical protein